eukprot:CAMPEP_0119393024 /NCGR_PEP_ID=MMETSP1334-20130426/123730_1 /TAXON_ID=127549 /ORGANISM="Calcidiscus leptoporus, Strain RCC1130" /LENGTH=151 /DNA_ID=CAMNT_0007415993 /DNA_START=131 /DNA_END=583 /DNA_ORIENTATION=-
MSSAAAMPFSRSQFQGGRIADRQVHELEQVVERSGRVVACIALQRVIGAVERGLVKAAEVVESREASEDPGGAVIDDLDGAVVKVCELAARVIWKCCAVDAFHVHRRRVSPQHDAVGMRHIADDLEQLREALCVVTVDARATGLARGIGAA